MFPSFDVEFDTLGPQPIIGVIKFHINWIRMYMTFISNGRWLLLMSLLHSKDLGLL
jgi:hypothetical protein